MSERKSPFKIVYLGFASCLLIHLSCYFTKINILNCFLHYTGNKTRVLPTNMTALSE